MKLGIIGLPQSGKTTIFNALTRGDKPVGGGRQVGRFEVQTAVVPVPDPRVDQLSALYKPRKTIYTQVVYADIAGLEAPDGAPSGVKEKSGFSGQLLNQLSTMDGFLHVVRAFENPTVPGLSNPARDVAAVEGELLLNVLLAVERKLERLNEDARKGIIKDKGLHGQETALFTRIKDALAAEQPLRTLTLSAQEEKLIASHQLLTRKPMLIVFNIGDEDSVPVPDLPQAVKLKGKLEMELAQLLPEDAELFMQEYGIKELGLNRVIQISYDLLGLQSFFTVGEDEVRAWTTQRGASAPEAAGEIHTDLREGFIRAEVFSYDDLMTYGSVAELKAKGRFRLEGKEYLVHDGDILNIRFSPPAKK
ncbi:MAG: redox-regulated ATPase YchF [Anaerolineales bacterium]